MKTTTIRAWWLVVSIAQLLFSLIIYSVLCSSLKTNASSLGPLSAGLVDRLPQTYAVGFVGSVIGFLILLHCAYRKPGTRLLSFCLFGSCIFSIPNGFYNLGKTQATLEILQQILPTTNPDLNQLLPLLFSIQISEVFGVLFLAIWCYFSWKLRNINKQKQLNQLLANPTYQLLFQDLQAADTLESLDKTYWKSEQQYPEISWHLKKQYKDRKLQLS